MPACNLLISDLRLWVHLGCSAEEKFSPQLVSIDIDLTFKSPPSGLTTDQLKDTLCYLEVVRNIQYFVQGKQFNLIEHLTHEIYRAINNLLLRKKHIISSVKVTTHKTAPPVPGVHGGVFFTYCNELQE
ncbi:dihydroneopterin aldolase [Wolbachia endosymbiont of Anurida maritima]|uniref:dihydroneopterin aldolase n=1 Tax=Wolbachia endosymbiont of Anurida maritima TaxID=2850562 RepID=UPI0035CE94F8